MRKIKSFLKNIGPGFVTGASDDDPSGIATYSQTGALFGYSQLWTAPFSFPFMAAIQEMCGRIGMVTGKGLAGVIKHYYSRPLLISAVSLLFFANTINVGANLGAMAASGQLLFNIPFGFWLITFTIITLILLVLVRYKQYSRFLKYLTFSLFAYVAAVFVIKQDWQTIFASTLFPNFGFNRDYLINIVAILGTTISPYLFFWQASQEVEEEVVQHKLQAMDRGTPVIKTRDIRGMRMDTIFGMFFSNLIMFFIIVTTASTLHINGIREIETAAQAAEALRPIAGGLSFWLFASGIIGTGLLAIPVLAGSASYAVSETLGLKAGLTRQFKDAPWFYSIIILCVLTGVSINFLPIPSFKMLYYTAVINGIAAPPLIAFILLIANNRKIMGLYTNTSLSNILGILITGVMTTGSVFLLLSFL